MSLFKNLFGCTCNNNGQNDINDRQIIINDAVKEGIGLIKGEIKKIEDDVNNLYRVKADSYQEIKRLEDKLNSNFSILSNKIDNVILILNTNK